MRQEILDFLYQPFEVHTKPGKGQFKFIESRDVIDRMNKAFSGNWSSEVINSEIIEDNIVVWARVYILDPETNVFFKQDGYGSSPIQRFTYGENQGKPVDLGNSYKSALSKAVKAACARWGAGLFIDEGDSSENFTSNPPVVPVAQNSQPVIPAIPGVPLMPAAPAPAIPTGPTIPVIPVSQAVPQSTPPAVVDAPVPPIPAAVGESSVPPSPAAMPSVPEPQQQKNPGVSIPSFPQNNIKESEGYSNPIPVVPSPGGGGALMGTVAKSDDKTPPTNIQKAALEGLVTVRNFNYRELAEAAFEANGLSKDQVPPMAELNADQATIIIGHANKFTRK